MSNQDYLDVLTTAEPTSCTHEVSKNPEECSAHNHNDNAESDCYYYHKNKKMEINTKNLMVGFISSLPITVLILEFFVKSSLFFITKKNN